MPRIAILCPNYHPRTCGIGDYSMRVASELLSRGVAVRIFSREPVAAHPDSSAVEVEGFPASSPGQAAWEAERRIAAWSATHVLVQYVPHMFGATRFGSPAMPLLVRRLRRRGLHVTVVAHELFIPWSPRPDSAAGSVAQRLQTAAMVAWSDRIVVTTGDRHAAIRPLARTFRTGMGDPVPVGSSVEPVRAARAGDHLRIGLFSTLSAEKRFDVVLDAFEVVGARAPDAELVLVGDLDSSGARRSEALRAAIRRHPGAARIVLTGKLTLPEVAARVATLDVFLFPMTCGATSRSSTLPLPLGAGVPVVAIRGPETPAYFSDGENIVFAQALTGPALAGAVQRLVDDPALHARVASGGQALFDHRLTWPRIVDALVPGAGMDADVRASGS